MTTLTTQAIIEKALFLEREIAHKSAQLKHIKADLVREARLHPEACTDTEGGGKSWTITGASGCIARVTFPGKSLKSELQGAVLEKIRTTAGRLFDRLFKPSHAISPVADFRKEAVSLLGEKAGKKLIALCETGSSPRVSFETARREEKI